MKPRHTGLRVYFAMIALSMLCACAGGTELVVTGPTNDPAAQVRRIHVVTDREVDNSLSQIGARRTPPQRVWLDISIPPSHEPGHVEFARNNPDASNSFTVQAGQLLTDKAAFMRALDNGPDRSQDVVVFVHGYNNSLADAVYRHAQMAHDYDLRGPQITYSWTSDAKPLGYIYDRDSITVARDGLEELLLDLARDDRRILLIGHSMGSQLVTETLRQLSISGNGWVNTRFSAVMLMSPDIDVDVFQAQYRRIDPLPEPFLIFVSQRDRALRLSARLTGQQERLGSATDIENLAAMGISVIDLSGFDPAGAIDHLTAANSASVISVLGGLNVLAERLEETGPTAIDLASVVFNRTVGSLLR